ncbi:beta-1,4-galactosyltransferase 1-like [Daphnia carinata]|uniref:beta-1,4-galactosyltransferase 1-like n=1 Tax=Daphnia carinata TaxID=120202 RepID=UPI00257FBBC9|nr:beta-1,4-galactosyltransferase 1-like [Daphnia carinata]
MAFRSRFQRLIFICVLSTILTIAFHNSSVPRLVEMKEQPSCPLTSPLLIGWTNISNWLEDFEEQKLLELGGSYRPANCNPSHAIAIIIPYRNRDHQLITFLHYIHPFIQRQQLDYTIFVVEQTGISAFNRGMLLNVGFIEALRRRSFDCFVFHDVDLLPEDDRNSYACPDVGKPRHLSVAISTFSYRPIGVNHFGGVGSVSVTDFVAVNGFSNRFWGWGGEDDDLFDRLRSRNFTVQRHQPLRQTRYTMLAHEPAEPNSDRKRILHDNKLKLPLTMMTDGLISLKYRIISIHLKRLCTHIIVELQR